MDDHRRRWREHRRDTFLAALRGDAIVTERARARIQELRAEAKLRTGPPVDPVPRGGAVEVDSEQFYAMNGISTEGAANQQIAALLRPVREFCGCFSRKEAPPMEGALAIVPALTALENALRASDPAATSDEVAHTGYGYLVEAASKIASVPELEATSDLGISVQRILDDGVSARWPEKGADDAHYEGGWGSLPGRIEAAEGLFSLFANPGFDAEHILANLRVLAQDRLPVVRFQVGWRLMQLHERAPEAMWELVESLAVDPNYRIRIEVIDKLNQWLARPNPDRALAIVVEMLEQAGTALGKPEEVATACIACLTGYYLWRDDPTAKAAIERMVEGLPASAHDAGRVFPTLREALKYVEPGDTERALRTRERAATLFNRIAGKAVPPMHKLIAKRLRREELTEAEQEQFENLERLLVVCGSELYFASGAFQEHRYALPPVLTTPEQTELFHALAPSWDLLVEIGSPGLVHHLVQTLEMFVPIDPARVFLLIGQSVLAGKLWRYQFESQAVDLVVRVIRTYIAEHRSIFEKNPECLRMLRELLDLFITAGWPSARVVAYRVDEVFR
jgi:hypothetical protein